MSLGECPVNPNSTTEVDSIANDLARHALRIFNLESVDGSQSWRGEVNQSSWKSACHAQSADEYMCDVVGIDLCFSHYPNALQEPR